MGGLNPTNPVNIGRSNSVSKENKREPNVIQYSINQCCSGLFKMQFNVPGSVVNIVLVGEHIGSRGWPGRDLVPFVLFVVLDGVDDGSELGLA